jgi:23S rRNA (uracil1939-C5)-methyltransferase
MTAPEEWLIERLVPGGDGLARLPDGRVAFASGTVPGDRIRPGRVEDRRSYVRAESWELAEGAGDRVEPECPVARQCGGCDWMMLSRPAELAQKERVLREALRRTGGFHDLPEEIPIVCAGPDNRYRNRLRLHVDEAGRIGLYARQSREVVEIPGCLVCDPEIDRALELVRSVVPRHPGVVAEIEIRVAPQPPLVVVRLLPRPGVGRAALEPPARELSESACTVIAGSEQGRGEQRFPLTEAIELVASPGVFTQANWAVNRRLVKAVVDGARERKVSRFLDVYAGAGNFALPLLAAGLPGVAVEQSRPAVECAERTARELGWSGAFRAGDAGRELGRMQARGERFDLVVLDPPRSGAREILPRVIDLEAPSLALCSCDPVTLARDLATLARAGWRLEQVSGFDMFPRTHHIEALAWMRRAG